MLIMLNHRLLNLYWRWILTIHYVIVHIRYVQDMDVIIIITTCREGYVAELAKEWLEKHNIHWDYFNENDPVRIELYKDCRKIYCDMLIDDTVYCFNMDDFE